ncbi:O-antigen ligase [Jannaschia sp. W003]|uniref:O-antigen ligase family protein n=1 Tax=Jannaschia sp. W003 TaxID=2867012 RepID=UPI0021A3D513|nr:O-antigen ligase family protein [Jannaschia sp. W003]UWQ21562.1 O-antigen ligase family protein [Jannaschia sp. W003]
MTFAAPAPPAARRIFGLRIDETRRDHILVTLWFLVTFKQFPGDELILYPMALWFFWSFVRDMPALIDLVARSWVLWLFPIWWMLSLSWGTETALIFKSGLQMILTTIICYCIALRLTARHIMISILIAASFYAVASVVDIAQGGVAARGAFLSKNAFGMAMVMLWIAAICTLLDGGIGRTGPARLLRPLALPTALLAAVLIQVSNSLTAVLLAAGSLVLIIGLRLVTALSGAALVAAATFALAALTTATAYGTFAMLEFDPITPVLEAFGKDATLTGRTVLWDYAAVEIEKDPWLGKGAGGFWTPRDGLSTAHRIYVEFHKAPWATFSFHNSYYEVAVHQGLIGVGLMVLATAWCVWRTVLQAFRTRRMPSIFFLCFAMVTLARSLSEPGLMMPFSLLSMLLIVGALLSLPIAAPGARARGPARPLLLVDPIEEPGR